MADLSVVPLLTAFAIVGGLETVDRTSFALIGLAARARPWGAWLGGSTAFVLTTALAVLVGEALEGFLGPSHLAGLRVAGGLFLIGYAIWTLLRRPEGEAPLHASLRGAFVAAFVTIGLLELGDTTMIFEVVLVPTLGWVAVLVGGAVGLVLVAAWDVWLGSRIGMHLRPETTRAVVGALLTVVGSVTVAYGLDPSAFPTL